MTAPLRRRRLSAERRRALELLASSPTEITEVLPFAHGVTPQMPGRLFRSGLATIQRETIRASGRTVQIGRVMVTDGGRRARKLHRRRHPCRYGCIQRPSFHCERVRPGNDGGGCGARARNSGPDIRLHAGPRGAVVRLSESGRVAFDRLSAPNRPIEGDFQVKRETAEKIIAAMKETDVALNRVHDALCEIENEEVRKQIIRKYFDLVNDAHVNITLEVVKYFPYLHPDKPKT